MWSREKTLCSKGKWHVVLPGEFHKLSNYISQINKYSLGDSGSLTTCAFRACQKGKIKKYIFNDFMESENSN